MQTCDDCFEDFEPENKNQIICSNCKPQPKYDLERCTHLWKVFCSRGFNTQDEIVEYQIVKSSYKVLRGRELPKLEEKVGKRK